MAFGLISILAIAPILIFLVESNFSPELGMNTEYVEQIDQDMLNLADNFKSCQENNYESHVFSFEFQGMITVIYDYLNDLTTLYMNFYYNETKSPIIRRCIFNDELNITVKSYQINQYSFIKDENMISLIFS